MNDLMTNDLKMIRHFIFSYRLKVIDMTVGKTR